MNQQEIYEKLVSFFGDKEVALVALSVIQEGQKIYKENLSLMDKIDEQKEVLNGLTR